MVDEPDWRPGSFTKNFSWGQETGLVQLYESIRIGFDGKLEEVSRQIFRERVSGHGRPDYIPINFFLFNRQQGGEDLIIVDELVFQALTSKHSDRFDRLALFAFNLSYAGKFKRSTVEQRRPAMWANHYIRDRVARNLKWDVRRVSANDIEQFVSGDKRYKAQGARKLATNLNHLYKIGKLSAFADERVERWWVDALFLALDRIIEDRRLDRKATSEGRYGELLTESGFRDVAGKRSLEKDLAAKHLVHLYTACGGRDRFTEAAVRERTALKLKDVEEWIAPNDEDPRGAIHPTNPRILKSIPAVCAMLATYAGFEVVSSIQMEDFDSDLFIRTRTLAALERLREQGVKPTMTAEEVLRMTRER